MNVILTMQELVSDEANYYESQSIDIDIPTLNYFTLLNIHNVVAAFTTRCHLNLRKIAVEGLHVEYRKEAGMRHPSTTATIWSSGKIVVTGANSEKSSKIASRKYSRILQRLGFDVHFSRYRVVNVLASTQMPFPLRINNFANEHKPLASYEPELHPGVTYQLKDPKATLKIFSTGSITITAPSVKNAVEAVKIVGPLLIPYQTPTTKRYHYEKISPKHCEANVQYGDTEVPNIKLDQPQIPPSLPANISNNPPHCLKMPLDPLSTSHQHVNTSSSVCLMPSINLSLLLPLKEIKIPEISCKIINDYRIHSTSTIIPSPSKLTSTKKGNDFLIHTPLTINANEPVPLNFIQDNNINGNKNTNQVIKPLPNNNEQPHEESNNQFLQAINSFDFDL